MGVVLAVINDVHAGSTVAVCPPRVELDDGGAYEASKVQLWLWQCWHDYWHQVESICEGTGFPLYIVSNGDLFDGDHHNTSQIISRNPVDWHAVVSACMEYPLSLGPERLFFVRGTEAHTGKSGSLEEGYARRLLADGHPVEGDPDTGTASWWHLRMEIEGVRIDVAHHGRTGMRAHTEGNAANLYAHDILLQHIKEGDPPPHLVLRAHYHRFNDSYDMAPVRVIQNGAWQLATAFGHRVATDKIAHIGGLIVVIEDGEYEPKKVKFKAKRGPVWVAS